MNLFGLFSFNAIQSIINAKNEVKVIIGIVIYPKTKKGDAAHETPSTEHEGNELGKTCNE